MMLGKQVYRTSVYRNPFVRARGSLSTLVPPSGLIITKTEGLSGMAGVLFLLGVFRYPLRPAILRLSILHRDDQRKGHPVV